jgi:hypothetical protein
MDNNNTSGGNTKQIKRISSPLVEGGAKGRETDDEPLLSSRLI